MFIVNCDNKGCMKPQAARLEVSSDEVLCAECGNVIKNITSFTKRQLKSLGQTTKRAKTTQTYSVKCSSCEASGVPKIEKDKITCAACKKELTNLSDHFKILLKTVLNNESK